MIGWIRKLLRGDGAAPDAPPPSPRLRGRNIKGCCLVPENLELVVDKWVDQGNGKEVPVQVHRCRECACKHHRILAHGIRSLRPGKVTIG